MLHLSYSLLAVREHSRKVSLHIDNIRHFNHPSHVVAAYHDQDRPGILGTTHAADLKHYVGCIPQSRYWAAEDLQSAC